MLKCNAGFYFLDGFIEGMHSRVSYFDYLTYETSDLQKQHQRFSLQATMKINKDITPVKLKFHTHKRFVL